MTPWQHPTGTFTPSPWQQQPSPQQEFVPDFADSDDLKKAFAIELALDVEPFRAALKVLDDDTPKALWASQNWPNDIAVIGYRDGYLKTLKAVEKPLDKSEILSKIRAFAEDKINGHFAVEAKERLNAWKLYAEISGFTGNNAAVDNTVNNVQNNLVKIVLVKPDSKTIDHQVPNTNSKSEMSNELSLPKLKLVGGGS